MASLPDAVTPTVQPANDSIDLLLISDQIGSSGETVANMKVQIKEHFEGLINCISSLPEIDRDRTLVIKNIGDSLMVRVTCDRPRLTALLSHLILIQDNLARHSTATNPVGLRVILIPLQGGDEEFIEGEEIPFSMDNGWGIKLRGTPDSLRSWVAGDLFGPRINLAFRAASLSVNKPILIIEDSIANYLTEGGKAPANAFIVAVSGAASLHVGEQLAFSPLRGVNDRYPIGRANKQGWDGHLYLRRVSRCTNEISSRNSLDELELEQQKYKAFTRFMWRGKPDKGRLNEFRQGIRGIMACKPYFRSMLVVEHEGEVRRKRGTRKLNGRVSKGDVDHDIPGPRPGDIGTYTGLIGVFAAPFEATYDHLRQNLLEQTEEGEGFAYPVSTIIYNPEERPTRFAWASNERRYLIVFWKWLPADRANRREQGEALMQRLVEMFPRYDLSTKRSGMVVGGEWDGYAVLGAQSAIGESNLILCKEKFRRFILLFREFVAQNVEASSLFICVDPGHDAPQKEVGMPYNVMPGTI